MLHKKGVLNLKRNIVIAEVCPFIVPCSRTRINFSSSHRPLTPTTAKFDFSPTGPCRVLEWAALPVNRSVASECLSVPSSQPPQMSTSRGNLNWEDYWTYRTWNFPDALKNDTEREYGRALASHVMTAPMTIYSMLDQLLETRSKVTTSSKVLTSAARNAKEKSTTMKVRWCCIGARSEASLPIQYWQEMIDMIHAARLSAFRSFMIDKCNNIKSSKPIVPKLLDITLDFIGPEMNIQPAIVLHPSNSLRHDEYDFVGDGTTTNVFTTCTVQWRYKGLYHIHYNEINAHEDVYDKQYDAYILFNPGIGHPYLQKLWRPTLQLIFEQYYRIRNSLNNGCTILLTAHSMTDALRDSELLQHYMVFANDYNTDQYISRTSPTNIENDSPDHQIQETVNYYTENPFASRIYYHDPIVPEQSNAPHIVRPNHYVALLRRR